MPYKNHIISLVITLALNAAAAAVPLRFVPWDDAVSARKLGLQNASGITNLPHLHPNKRSDPMDGTASRESPLRLVAMDRKDAEGRHVTLDIRLVPELKSPLVLILPDEKHASGLRTYVIEDNLDNFGWGTSRFINSTGKELLVRQEKTVKSLPAKWTPVDFKPGGEMRNMGMQIAAREDINSILFSSVWEHNPDMRLLVFLVPSTDVRTGPIALKVITEDRRAIAMETSLKKSEDTSPPPTTPDNPQP